MAVVFSITPKSIFLKAISSENPADYLEGFCVLLFELGSPGVDQPPDEFSFL